MKGVKDKSFRNMNIHELSICIREMFKGDGLSDSDIERFYICYARSNGNTVGCPPKAFRKEMGIEDCARKCSECWNVCLNHVFDMESLGEFWKV